MLFRSVRECRLLVVKCQGMSTFGGEMSGDVLLVVKCQQIVGRPTREPRVCCHENFDFRWGNVDFRWGNVDFWWWNVDFRWENVDFWW